MLPGRVPAMRLGKVTVLTGSSLRLRGHELASIKRKVARRSRGLCECTSCQQSGHPLPAQEYDHRVPLWEGGGNGLDNWQHLNARCHARKTAAEHRRRLGLDRAEGPDPGA
jgi:5-methylcytosine-specific restriction endonuclease McrA